MGKKKKKPVRGSGFSVTLPTEPTAGAAKDAPIMAVLVQDEGVQILEYEIKEGQSINFRVGAAPSRRSCSASGPAPDGDMFLDANADNRESVVVEYAHALAGTAVEAVGSRVKAHDERCAGPPLEIHRKELGVNYEA